MDNLIHYKGHYIWPELFVGKDGGHTVGFTTTLPEEAVPPAACLRGFLTVASSKKYITRYGKKPKIRRVM